MLPRRRIICPDLLWRLAAIVAIVSVCDFSFSSSLAQEAPADPILQKKKKTSLNAAVSYKPVERKPAASALTPAARLEKAEEGEAPAPSKIKVDMSVQDRRLGSHSDGLTSGSFVPRLGFEESSIRQVRVKAKTLDDRIRVTATVSRSLYSADPSYLMAVAHMNDNAKFVGKERFLAQQNNEGFAGRERIDATLFREGQFKASVFTKFTHVDQTYYAPTRFGRDGIAQPYVSGAEGFRLRERSGATGGGEIRFGALSLVSSYTHGRIADRIGSHAEQRIEHTLSWDMQDDAYLTAALPTPFIALLPTSIRSGVFQTAADPEFLKPNLYTTSNGVTAGASWERDGLSLNLDYYSYDSKTAGGRTGPFLSKGSGVSADLQFDLGNIGLKAGLSYGPGRDSGRDYSANNSSYSSNVTVSYKPEKLPDLSMEVNFGKYAYREVGEDYNSAMQSKYRNAVFALDFKKYFQVSQHASSIFSTSGTQLDVSNLKLFYLCDYFSDAALLGQRSPVNNVIGFSLNAIIH